MVEMRDELMRLLESMTHRVREDALAFDVVVEDFLEGVGGELDDVARRVGLLERHTRPPTAGWGAPHARTNTSTLSQPAPETLPETSVDDENVVARCFGCLLSLICGQQLAMA